MEFMPRGSLWGFLASRRRGPSNAAAPPLTASQQRAVALDIACGLAYLHAIPILHLDLKVSGLRGGPRSAGLEALEASVNLTEPG